MKKKLLLVLSLVAIMTVLFAISISAASPAETWDVSATSSDNVTAYLYADDENEGMYNLAISGTGEMTNWTSFTYVPWYSSYGWKISSVTIENGVTSIGDNAFYMCEGIGFVDISESVVRIGNYAFFGCYSLVNVVIRDGLKSIGKYAFYYCQNLMFLYLPDSVNEIEQCAFGECYMLQNINIPTGVTEIKQIFYSCHSLSSIYIPKTITYIGGQSFEFCDKLTIYIEASAAPVTWDRFWNYYNHPVKWEHTHTYTNGKCVCGKNNVIDSSWKWDVSEKGDNSVIAYLACDVENEGLYTLTFDGKGKIYANGITINGVVTSYVNLWTGYESRISKVYFGKDISGFGKILFDGFSSLTEINVDIENQHYRSVDGILFSKNCTSLVKYPSGKLENEFTVSGKVTRIDSHCFFECENIKHIKLPTEIVEIDSLAFYRCGSLTIYCEAETQPSGWDSDWNRSSCPVV